MESDTTKWERMRNYYDSVRHPEGECDTCDEYRELCERLAPTFYDNLAAARAEAERLRARLATVTALLTRFIEAERTECHSEMECVEHEFGAALAAWRAAGGEDDK